MDDTVRHDPEPERPITEESPETLPPEPSREDTRKKDIQRIIIAVVVLAAAFLIKTLIGG